MKTLVISTLTAVLLTLSSCNKYAEGPMLSLRSKTERVANSWRVGQALDKGSDVTSDYNKFDLVLTKGGSATLSAEYSFFGNMIKYTTEGSWVFVSDKDKISFDFNNDEADGVYTILRLKEKEMWLKEDGGDIELHFVPN